MLRFVSCYIYPKVNTIKTSQIYKYVGQMVAFLPLRGTHPCQAKFRVYKNEHTTMILFLFFALRWNISGGRTRQ